MITTKVSKEEFFASTFIAKQTSIVCMHPINISVVNNVFNADMEQDSKIAIQYSYTVIGTEIPEPGLLDVKIGLEVLIDFEDESKAKQDNSPIVKIEIQYLIRYSTPTEPIPEDIKNACLPAFSKISAVIQCWPYLRQLVNQLTSEIGCPYMLPVIVFDPDDDDVSDHNISPQKPSKKSEKAGKKTDSK